MNTYASKYGPIYTLSLLSVFFLMLTFTAYALASGKEMKKEVGEAATAIGEYTVEQKDAAVAKAKELMDALDRKTELLESKIETKWGNMQEQSRESYQQSLRELRERRNQLSEWYGGMKQSSNEAWLEVKQGFSDTYDGIVQAYTKTEEEVDAEK